MHFEKPLTYYQRGKVRAVSRKPKLYNNVSSNHKGNESSDINHATQKGIFNNPEITSVLAQHAIGNIGEIRTNGGDKIVGVIKAISPSGDIGLAFTYSHKASDMEPSTKDAVVVPISDWKTIRIADVKFSDCLMNDPKIDTELSNETESQGIPSDRELVPFFSATDEINDCVLEQGGFPAAEMFKTNEQLFSVSSTYNPDLLEYTTPVDRTALDYSETEARCAQLAKDIEGNHPTHVSVESVYGDEEMAYSAVVRAPRDETTNHGRKCIDQGDDLKITGEQISKLSIDLHNEISVQSVTPINSKPAESDSAISSSEPTSISPVPSTVAATTQSMTIDKPKKSTLDPNAPEFKPMSLQCSSTQVSVAPLQPSASNVINPHVHSLVNFGTTNPMQVQFMATPQTVCGPRPISYASAGGNLGHMLPNAISTLNNGVAQHMRGNSLPPSLHQQNFPQLNPPSNIIIQPNHSGISVPQIGASHPALMTGPGPAVRFLTSPPAAINRQRTNETSTPSHSVYGQVPTNNSIPFYHLSQPWLAAGHHPMSLHLLPTGAGSPALMIGNPQNSGQVYTTHPLLQMQQQLPMHGMQVDQLPSTTSQQNQPSVFPVHPSAFQEQAHSIQMPPYTPNIMLTSQHHVPSYYPAAPAVFGAPTNLNPSAQSNLFTIVNQQPQHSVAGNVGHQTVIDQGLVSSQLPIPSFPTTNYQHSHFLQQYNAAQLLHTQQLNAAHLNPQTIQPGSYHALAAMVASAANSSGQTH